jgi:hypothetical protein
MRAKKCQINVRDYTHIGSLAGFLWGDWVTYSLNRLNACLLRIVVDKRSCFKA